MTDHTRQHTSPTLSPVATSHGRPRGSNRRRLRAPFAVRPLALALAASSLLSFPPGMSPARAQTVPGLPSGMTVVNGQVKAVTTGKQLTITNSSGSILNWQNFSIGAGNGVTFVQPNAQSQVLNRVVGNDPSSILGSLSSNGRVWLLNPNGVIFGQVARVDVGGLVTSTLNLNDIDWLGGRYNFTSSGTPAGIVNQGELRSSLGGHIALIGGSVRNEGLIEAPGGQILLAAGKSIELVDTGSPNMRLLVTAPEGEALNLGTLAAAGGRIDVHAAVVNQQGVIRADSLETGPTGNIVLKATQALNLAAGSVTSASGEVGGTLTLDSGRAGTTLLDGQVLATGSSGTGGEVTLLGRHVGLQGSALVDASGGSGGGQVRVGGGERGLDSSVPNADAVYVGQDVRISADATGQGNGGRLILWSDQATRAYGTFTARGGAQGGNGGFIETSGGWIDVRPAKIDATASLGTAGTWLLDPWNLLITDVGPTAGVTPTTFSTATQASGTGAVIASADIRAALNAGNSVVISTGTTGTEAGDIAVVNANLVAAPSRAVGLTLQAARDIIVFGSAFGSSNSTPVSLTLQAATGSVELRSASTVDTRGGNVSMAGASSFSPGFAPYGVYLTEGSAINAGSGTVTLAGTSSTSDLGVSGSVNAAGVFIDRFSNISARSISITGSASTSTTTDGVFGVYVAGSLFASTTINISGNSVAPSSKADTGVSFSGANVTATDGLTVTGTGGGLGVLTTDSRLGVTRSPNPFNPTAELTITGTSNRTELPDSSYSGSGVLMVNNTLRATNGARISVTGYNQTQQNALTLFGGFVDAATGGDVTLRGDSNAIARVNVNVDLTAGGSVQVRGDFVTLGGIFRSNAVGDAIIVAGARTANTLFFNNGGAAFNAPRGRWLVYGQNPSSVIATGLAHDFRKYNAFFGQFDPNTPTAGNGILYATAPTITLSGTNLTKTYDGNPTISLLSPAGVSFTGLQSGDVASLAGGATGTFIDKDAGLNKVVNLGSPAITVVGADGKPVLGYRVVSTGTITPKTLTLSGLSAANKVYDGNTTASVTVAGLSGLVGAETLGTTTTGSFDTKDAGTAKTVSVGVALANGSNGGLASNYRLAPLVTTTADVTPRQLTTTVSAASKVYDGTTNRGAVTFLGVGNLVAGESIGVGIASGSFDSKDVGAAKPLSLTFSLGNGSGPNAGLASNYLAPVPTATTADITPKTVTVGAVTAANKVYDGNTVTSVTLGALSGLVGSETLTTSASGNFDTKDAGTGKTVTVNAGLANGTNGGLASNYRLVPVASTTADITPKTLSLNGLVAANKVYDGNTTASVTLAPLTGLVGSETLGTTTTTGSFDTKDAGTAKTVSVGVALTNGSNGGLASNYSVASTATTTADITPKTLTLSGFTAANKVYDGNATASVTVAGLTGLVGTETLGTTTTSGSFDTKDAGIAKTVTVGVTLANGSNGGLASNYRVAPTTSTTADITPKALTVMANNANKAYGNTLTFAGNEFTSSGLVGSETIGSVSLTSTGAAASASVAGGPYAIIASNAVGGTFSMANYKVSYVNGTLTINPAELNAVLASIVGNPTKVYDGTSTATLTPSNFSLSGFFGSDGASVTKTSGTYSSADAGSRTVSTTLANGDFAATGSTDLRNYTLPTTASGTGTITQKTLTLTGVAANNKAYDGTTVASLSNTGTLGGLVGGQTLTLNNTGATFDTKDAGTGKTVTVGGITLVNGTGLASNYQVAATAITTADVTPKTLTLSGLSVANKVYDGNTSASVTLAGLTGLVGTETLGTTTTGSFDTQDAGNGKTVTVGVTLANGSNGGLASNYRVAPTTSTTADITPKALTVMANNANKAYGNTLTFAGNEFTSSGLVGSETIGSVSLTSTGAAASASVAGGPYAIIASNAVGGTFSMANYKVSYVNGTLTINPAELNAVLASIVGNPTKVYDGTSTATLTPSNFSLSGFFGSDGASVTKTSGTYSSADAGSRTVSTTLANGDFAATGSTDLRNYTLPTTASGTGTITQKTLTLTGVAANNKAYDGTTVASLSNTGTLGGLVGGQTLTLNNTGATFDTKDAGTGKTVTVGGITLANGTGLASNYQVAATATTTADITPKTLTLTGLSAANKVYDGTTTASVTLVGLNGLVGAETLGTTTSGSFDTKNAGTAKTVTIAVTLANGSNGGLAGNYRVTPPTTTADITPATLTYVANPANKIVGAPSPALSGTVSGFVTGETLATATSGSLGFSTPADVASPAGSYAINGGGLAATNYRFVQAAGNANALTVTGLPPQVTEDPVKVALSTSLTSVALPAKASSPAEGRVADVVTSLRPDASSTESSFQRVSIGTMSQDELIAMLNSRDRYKKNIFEVAIRKLEQDPKLADSTECTSIKDAETGSCLITEKVKNEIRAARAAALIAVTPEVAAPVRTSPPGAVAPEVLAPVRTPPPAAVAAAATAAPKPGSVAAKISKAREQAAVRRRVLEASLPQIERKFAVVIGVDEYEDSSIPGLDHSVGDSRAIGQVLETSLGYETLYLENASKQRVIAALNRLAVDVGPKDSVVIYYAGHGELIESTKLGYWQLADSDAKDPTTWLSNSDITRLLGQIGASQIALISDSCYSGALVDGRIRANSTQVDPNNLLGIKSVVVMSSGGNEPVFDEGKQGHSPFAYSLMNNLRQVANWQIGGNVFERVRFQVARELPQRPQYGSNASAGHQAGGDYLFELRRSETNSPK